MVGVAEQAGIVLHHIDVRSPWQQGRTGRAGGALKDQIVRAIEHLWGVLEEEVDLVVTEVVDARNRFIIRSGFGAHQRVYGKSLRLPASLLSDDCVNRELLQLAVTDDYQRSHDIRQAAMQALVRHTDRRALAAAVASRSRVQ
ncbi:MAG: hypothetical protein ACKPKO_23045, partial [Candidatus Fonsibacter sp.]